MSLRQGELQYKEGQTPVKDFFKTIAKNLCYEEWTAINPKKDPTIPWTFGIDRKIRLPRKMKPEMVKPYKVVADTKIIASKNSYGFIKILESNLGGSSFSCLLKLNDEQYQITIGANATVEEIVSTIATYIKTQIPIFADTSFEGNTITVTGAANIYQLELTDHRVMKTDFVVDIERTPLPTEVSLRLLGVPVINTVHEYTFFILVDGVKKELAVNVPKITSATLLTDVINNFIGQIVVKYASDNLSAKKGTLNNEIIIYSTTEENLSVNLVDNINLVPSKAIPYIKTTTTLNPDTSHPENVKIQALTDIPFPAGSSISFYKPETINQPPFTFNFVQETSFSEFATLLQTDSYFASSYSTTVADGNIITLTPNSTATSINFSKTNYDIPTNANIAMYAEQLEPGFIFTLRAQGIAAERKIIEVSIDNSLPLTPVNASVPGIVLEQLETEIELNQKIASVIMETMSGQVQAQIIEDGKAVVIKGATVPIKTLEINIPAYQKGGFVAMAHIIRPQNFLGEVTFKIGLQANSKLRFYLNNILYVWDVEIEKTANELADFFLEKILELSSFLLSEKTADNTILVYGNTSVIQFEFDALEIDTQYYQVQEDEIKGLTTDTYSGTRIGDNVIIKVRDAGKILELTTFTDQYYNETLINAANLLTRPKGAITVYEVEAKDIKKAEALQKMITQPIFSLPSKNICRDDNTLKLYKGVDAATATELNKQELDYTIDYYNGLIFFKTSPLLENEHLYVDYNEITDNIVDMLDPTLYELINNKIVVVDETIKYKNIMVAVNYHWELVYPKSMLEFENDHPSAIFKTYIDVSELKNKSLMKPFFLEFRKAADTVEVDTGVDVRIGTEVDYVAGARPTLAENHSSTWSRLAWYRNAIKKKTQVNNEMSVAFFMNFTQEYLNLVVQGNPSYDVDYTNYLISPLMFGVLDDYEGSINTDEMQDVYFTVGSDRIPKTEEKWGSKTGNATTDIVLSNTISKIPYQAHYPAFHTTPEWMEKYYINTATTNNAEQVGEIIIYHPIEKARGKIQSVLVGDRSNIEHLGILVEHRDKFEESGALIGTNGSVFNECGGPQISQEKTYIQINLNSPYSMFNNSPNILYGVCMRKA